MHDACHILWYIANKAYTSAAWWRDDMEALYELLALCEENPSATRGSPHKGPVMRCSDVSIVVSLLKKTVK